MEQVQRAKVWGGWWRLAHAAAGLSVLVLIATGWLIAQAPSIANTAADIHLYAASVLIFALVVRIALGFFGSPVERFVSLVPREKDKAGMRDMAIFYARLGRATPPRWYAHNPLWKPVYLAFYLLLVLQAVSGGLQPESPVFLGFYLPELHRDLARFLVVLTVLHIVAVVVHDYRGNAADVSSIINGHRHFIPEKPTTTFEPVPKETAVRLDQLKR